MLFDLAKQTKQRYLDDRLEMWGVSEEDTGFKNDTGSTTQVMQDMYDSFGATMEKL